MVSRVEENVNCDDYESEREFPKRRKTNPTGNDERAADDRKRVDHELHREHGPDFVLTQGAWARLLARTTPHPAHTSGTITPPSSHFTPAHVHGHVCIFDNACEVSKGFGDKGSRSRDGGHVTWKVVLIAR
eukprot:3370865-Rhodomonas_salina.3